MLASLLISAETDSEATHEGDELFGSEVALSESLNDETARVCLGGVLDCVTLSSDVLSSHVEDHGGTTTVLNSGVATELDQIGIAEMLGDMVTVRNDFLNLSHGEGKLFGLSDGQLVLEHECSRGTSN